MSRSDADHVAAAREHLRMLTVHMGRGDLADETIFDAACLRLAAAIESVGNLPDDTIEQEFGTDWAAIWSVRNRISHGYMFLDREIIEDTLHNDIGPFIASLDRIAARLDPDTD